MSLFHCFCTLFSESHHLDLLYPGWGRMLTWINPWSNSSSASFETCRARLGLCALTFPWLFDSGASVQAFPPLHCLCQATLETFLSSFSTPSPRWNCGRKVTFMPRITVPKPGKFIELLFLEVNFFFSPGSVESSESQQTSSRLGFSLRFLLPFSSYSWTLLAWRQNLLFTAPGQAQMFL